MTRKKKLLLGVLLATVLIPAALVVAHPRGRTALRLAPGFAPLAEDSRVYYEPGGEATARAYAEVLPAAITLVEARQAGPFLSEFRVYVCATHESFTRRIAAPASSPVVGIQFPRDVWLSPRGLSQGGGDTRLQTLGHELAHLHLGQHLGWLWRARNIPSWFAEGLADWASDRAADEGSPRSPSSRPTW